MTGQAILIDPTKPSSRNLAYLKAGAPIIIDLSTPAGQKKRFSTTFIGYLPKKYVLVEFPDTGKLGNFSQYIGQGTVLLIYTVTGFYSSIFKGFDYFLLFLLTDDLFLRLVNYLESKCWHYFFLLI